jgi:hypothetical protein
MASSPCFEIVPKRVAPLYATLPEIARRVLRVCDGTRSPARICEASGVSADAARAILMRLISLGVVIRSTVRVRNRRVSPEIARWIGGAVHEPVEEQLQEQATPETTPPETTPPETSPQEIKPERSERFSDDEESFFSRSIDHLVSDEYAD